MKTKIKIEIEGKDDETLSQALGRIAKGIKNEDLHGKMVSFNAPNDVLVNYTVEDVKDKEDWKEELGYEVSDNQVQFLNDAEEQGLEIRTNYSGRGMFGQQCPGVVVDDENKFTTKARTIRDGMGLQMIIYCPR